MNNSEMIHTAATSKQLHSCLFSFTCFKAPHWMAQWTPASTPTLPTPHYPHPTSFPVDLPLFWSSSDCRRIGCDISPNACPTVSQQSCCFLPPDTMNLLFCIYSGLWTLWSSSWTVLKANAAGLTSSTLLVCVVSVTATLLFSLPARMMKCSRRQALGCVGSNIVQKQSDGVRLILSFSWL